MAVRAMTLAERGCYIDLLAHSWNEGSIPDNDQEIARTLQISALKWSRLAPRVRARFYARDGRLFNKRLEEVRDEQQRFTSEKRKGGLASAAARAQRKANRSPTEAQQNGNTTPTDGQQEGQQNPTLLLRTATATTTAYKAHTYWCTAWSERWPDGIVRVTQAKLAVLDQLRVELGDDQLAARLERYMQDDSAWLIKHKHPLAVFINSINTYDSSPPPTPVRPTNRIRNCPQCHAEERGHDDTCDHCDWTRSAWEARKR